MDTSSLQYEFATWEAAAGFSPSSFLGYMPDPDPVLRKRGDEASIIKDLIGDDEVCQSMLSRKYRVLNDTNYEVVPSIIQPGRAAKNLAKAFTKDLENTTMGHLISTMLDAPFYGYSVLEVLWEARGGWWHIAGVKDKPWNWFAFDEQDRLTFRGEHPIAELVPEGKCAVTRHFPTCENPYGLRLLSRCLWPVAFKKGGIQYWVKFCEKFGLPWPIATAISGAKREERLEVAADLGRMVAESAACLPSGWTAALHSAPAGQGDIHHSFIRYWDAAIKKVLMGQTLTSDIGATGSYAATKTHKDVASDIAKADRGLVTSTFNELAWIYAKLNGNGTGEDASLFRYLQDADLLQQSALDKNLHSLGVRFKAKYFAKTYKLEEDTFTVSEKAEPEPAPAQEEEEAALAFAAPGSSQLEESQAELDQAIAAAIPRWMNATQPMIEAFKQAISESSSFDELSGKISDLLCDAELGQQLAEGLTNAMTNAAAHGFVEATNGA